MKKYPILIILIIFISYANALLNDFVYDDDVVIVENNFIKSPKNLSLLFDKRYLTHPQSVKYLGIDDIGSGEATYRPIATLSHFITYGVFKLNPFGWHLINILLHSFCAILTFYLVKYLFGNQQLSFFASLIFGIHPISVEVINCSAFRPNILALLFSLLSIILYFKYHSEARASVRRAYLIASLFSSIFALLSKEIAIILLPALVVCDYFKNELSFKAIRDNVKIYLSYVLAYLLYFYIYFFIFPPTLKNFVPAGSFKFTKGLLRMFNVFGIYFRDLVLPIDLTFISPYFSGYSLFITAIAIGVTTACLYIIFKKRRRLKAISFGAIWFFLWLLPMNNFLFPSRIPAAYRYLYIPMLGFSLILGACLLKLWNRDIAFLKKKFFLSRVSALAVLFYFSINTVSANFLWKNNLILHAFHVRRFPNNIRAHATLAHELLERGGLQAAQKEYEYVVDAHRNLKTQPEPFYCYLDSYFILGKIYKDQGLYSKAEQVLRDAEKRFPRSRSRIYVELGVLYIDKGLYKQALEYFGLAKKEDPLTYSAYVGSAESYVLMGEVKKAQQEWLRALEIKPNSQEAIHNLEKLKHGLKVQMDNN